MPKVSVVMPTYNGASRGFLSFAIESVLQQSFDDLELLIIDDGSTDETRDLCKRYLVDSRDRYIFQENSGVSVARNKGIEKSNGEYVAFLDDDDVWVREKLQKQFDLIERVGDEGLGLCYTALECIDHDGNKTGGSQSHHASGDVFFEMLCKNIVDCTSSVVVPKNVFDDVGGFDKNLSHAEDYDLWLRIAKKYCLYSVDEPLVLYREHGDKLSASLDKIESNALCVVERAIDSSYDVDRRVVLNSVYKYRAAYRFWLGDYKKFREHVRCASVYGRVGAVLRVRYWMSYSHNLVRATRKIYNFTKRFF